MALSPATIKIDQTRLAQITELLSGGHEKNNDGAMCAMEAVAYIAREKWSDNPRCACPVLSAFMRSWNDALPDDERTKLLLPIIPRLVGTRGSEALEARRATMAADWYVRVATPAWLRLAGLDQHADTLAAFPEITSFEKTPSIRPALEAAQKDAEAAWSAAWSAAESAAESAAWSAAWSAAESAAWSAAESAAESAAWSAAESAAWSAARSAAWSAARSAARSAAESAAWSAAESALDETKTELQASALDLLNRMIDVQDEAVAA